MAIEEPASGFPMNQPAAYSSSVQRMDHQSVHGQWSTGLCDCFSDVSNCCLTCWCPCIAFGRINEIVNRGSPSCGVSGALYSLICVFTGCQWIYSCTCRSKIKNQYGMKSSCCADCCVHFWCEQCAICQEYRELQNRGYDVSLGWHGNSERQNRGVTMVGAPIIHGGMKP